MLFTEQVTFWTDALAAYLLLLSLLVGFLFGTSLQKLFGELFGFHCVP